MLKENIFKIKNMSPLKYKHKHKHKHNKMINDISFNMEMLDHIIIFIFD